MTFESELDSEFSFENGCHLSRRQYVDYALSSSGCHLAWHGVNV